MKKMSLLLSALLFTASTILANEFPNIEFTQEDDNTSLLDNYGSISQPSKKRARPQVIQESKKDTWDSILQTLKEIIDT